ncbi:transposase [Sorangium cellulosum]|uniref:Transposase n=1 Tax=Sorangium cellulosum TaxID=56 RepID=A0A4P2QRV1_SORCE|nr:Rpn family recombination-promoting nuclease/putative transposase [Sorangium cellulosum]AUX32293.1 transposase [Sorangium cellulosum]WCQ91667.1 transposase [Sorangium sp. Soce836]
MPHAEVAAQACAELAHDALFQWTFSQREHAVGLLRAALPPPLVAAVRWGTLRVEKGSFVDRALRSRHSDLVLSARVGEGRVYFYVIVEQQRDVEALMVFRMGLYMMRLWEQLVREQPGLKKLPPIMPVLVHHSDTGWTAARAFEDIVAIDGPARAALLPHIPRFELRLIDVSGGRAGDLVEQALTALGKVVLWCLSVSGDDARLEREIGRIAAALDEVLQAPSGLAALEALLRYLVATHARFSARKIGRLLEKAAGPRAQEAIVNALDEIERRGERRGRAQGRAQTLLELLAARFGAVPADVSARILAANEAALVAWTTRVLTAPTPEDVLAEDGERPAATRRPAARKRARRV